MERTLQCLQDATWVSLKWSCAVLVIMTFFVAHAGQENWIAHPVLVPCISGFKGYCFFIGAFFLTVFFTTGATTKNRPGNRIICAKKVSQILEGTVLVRCPEGSRSVVKTV